MKPEIRNPKSEGMANDECQMAFRTSPGSFVWASNVGFLSSFGIRHSAFFPEVAL
jgi:hypothetical protein